MAKTASEQSERRLTGLQKGLLGLCLVALVGSVAWRFVLRSKDPGAGGAVPAGASGLVEAGPGGQPAEPPSGVERALPYVTESSFFGLIGFALGYASRKFVKVGLILLALFFVGLQALVWTGNVSVDWGGLVGKLNALLFNLKENESVTQFLARRVPSGAGLLAGYVFGFQRG